MRNVLLSALVLVVLPACESFKFEAVGTESIEVAATGVHDIRCRTHNGSIDIEASPQLAEIQITAHKRVRAVDQITADAALRELEIVSATEGGELQLYVKKRSGPDWNASVSFTVKMPVIASAKLTTHNGGIRIQHVKSSVDATTHNGGIRVQGSCNRIALESHNGAIACKVHGEGAVDGSIETHNGGVVLEMDARRSVKIDASTHNGGLSAREPIQVTEASKRRMRARLGTGNGSFRVKTHNGAIRLRPASE